MADQHHHHQQPPPSTTFTVEVVNLRPPSKLPSRPHKLRKLSPENPISNNPINPNSNSNSNAITTKPLSRTRQLNPSIRHRPLSIDGEVQLAIKHLRAADPILAKLIDTHDPPSFDSFQTPFLALTKSILYQQLAFKAGSSIYSRFLSLCGGESSVTPQSVLSLTSQQLRHIGVSSRKASYLHDLASKYEKGILSDSSIVSMDDKTLNTMLTMVNGIGSWSVHMFMIFSLHRPDVLPVNDLGIRKGVHLLFGLDDLPRPSKMEQLCEKWRPYRSVASWYVWRFIEANGVPSVPPPPPPPPPTRVVLDAPPSETAPCNDVGSVDMGLEREISSLPLPSLSSTHQQQHSQHQLQYLDPINGIMNLG